MRSMVCVAVVGVLLVAESNGRAGEREARALLERAIKAQGGASALLRARQCKRTDTGLQSIVGREVPFTAEVVRSLPDRLRVTIDLNRKLKTTVVVDGERGWQSDGGPATVLLPARVRELQEELHVSWAATLTPLLEPGHTLDTLPPVKIDGESASGIKVSRKGRPDLALYFLDRNGLLARINRQGYEGGTKVDKEYLFSGYKEFDGVKLPTRETVKINGAQYTTFTISNVSFPAKLDFDTFRKP